MWYEWITQNRPDTDLVSWNIKDWVNIFGVEWTFEWEWMWILNSFAFIDMNTLYAPNFERSQDFKIYSDATYIYFLGMMRCWWESWASTEAMCTVGRMHKTTWVITKYTQKFYRSAWVTTLTCEIQQNWTDINFTIWWAFMITFDTTTFAWKNLWTNAIRTNRPFANLPTQWNITLMWRVDDPEWYDWVAYVAASALTNSVIYWWNTYSTWYRWVLWQSGNEYVYTLIIEALKS